MSPVSKSCFKFSHHDQFMLEIIRVGNLNLLSYGENKLCCIRGRDAGLNITIQINTMQVKNSFLGIQNFESFNLVCC